MCPNHYLPEITPLTTVLALDTRPSWSQLYERSGATRRVWQIVPLNHDCPHNIETLTIFIIQTPGSNLSIRLKMFLQCSGTHSKKFKSNIALFLGSNEDGWRKIGRHVTLTLYYRVYYRITTELNDTTHGGLWNVILWTIATECYSKAQLSGKK